MLRGQHARRKMVAHRSSFRCRETFPGLARGPSKSQWLAVSGFGEIPSARSWRNDDRSTSCPRPGHYLTVGFAGADSTVRHVTARRGECVEASTCYPSGRSRPRCRASDPVACNASTILRRAAPCGGLVGRCQRSGKAFGGKSRKGFGNTVGLQTAGLNKKNGATGGLEARYLTAGLLIGKHQLAGSGILGGVGHHPWPAM